MVFTKLSCFPRSSRDAKSCPIFESVVFPSKAAPCCEDPGTAAQCFQSSAWRIGQRTLSLPQDDAQRVIESAIIPPVTSGAGLLTFPSIPVLRSCRAAAVRAQAWESCSRAAVLALTCVCVCVHSRYSQAGSTLVRCWIIYENVEAPVNDKCMNGPLRI